MADAAPGASPARDDAKPYQKKRIYAKACLACRSRKVKCLGADSPPCLQCRQGNFVCQVAHPGEGRATPSKRPRQNSSSDAHAGHTLPDGVEVDFKPSSRAPDLEDRIRRIEQYLGFDSFSPMVARSRSISPAGSHRSTDGPGIKADVSSEGGDSADGGSATQLHDGLAVDRSSASARYRAGFYAEDDTQRESLTKGPRRRKRSAMDIKPDSARISRAGTMDLPRYVVGPSGPSGSSSTYHGETSMHDDFDPALPGKRVGHEAMAQGAAASSSRAWEEDRIRLARRHAHIYASPEEGEAFMLAHFCWASQSYSVIHRPYFLRDMISSGPFFSQLLLLAAYLSGVRFTASLTEAERDQRSEGYFEVFSKLLMEEMRKPPTGTTIQALLVVSGRQCAVGRSSEAWLYTGMAIRMMQDMGIHLPLDEVVAKRFSAEERESRERLYWSAYTWDKSLALTLGREPSLIFRPGHSPDKILDESDDATLWVPLMSGIALPIPAYPPARFQSTRVLRYSCRLNIILESVLLNMYSPERPNARNLSFVRSAHEKLDGWWTDLPADLKIERPDLPEVAPPSNIMLINFLYHTLRILLYRPLLTSTHQPPGQTASSLDICRSAATSVHDCISLWGRTFGYVNMVYMMMYSTFVAACLDVVLLRVGNKGVREEARGRVWEALHVLELASSQGPGIRQGIATIRSQLERATRGEFATPTQTPAGTMSPQTLSKAEARHYRDQRESAGAPHAGLSGIPPHILHYQSRTSSPLATSPAYPAPHLHPPLSQTLFDPSAPSPMEAQVDVIAFQQSAEPSVSSTTEHAGTSWSDQGPGPEMTRGTDGYWLDTTNLLDLLGSAPISSDDPFAFGVSGDWGGWAE